MKLTITREDVLGPLQAINNVVERRQTLPILGNVLVSGEEKAGVTLTATDMEVEIIVEVAAEVKSSGAVTVPARKFLDICRALPGGADLSLSIQDEKVRIQSGRSRFCWRPSPQRSSPPLGRSNRS